MNKISDKLSDDDKQKWKNVISRFSDQNRSVVRTKLLFHNLNFSRVLLASIRNLTKVDGYQSWREIEHESLSKLIQTRLNALQNPSKPCTDVERVTYRLNENCGYGCQIHRAMRCFLIAYALNRTMILISGIFYIKKSFFQRVFQMDGVIIMEDLNKYFNH